MSDEELSRKVKHYENIERIGGKLIIVMIIALFLAAFLQDNFLIVFGLIAFIVLLMFLLPMRAEGKKNALLTQQLGSFFYGELARMFGPAPKSRRCPLTKRS